MKFSKTDTLLIIEAFKKLSLKIKIGIELEFYTPKQENFPKKIPSLGVYDITNEDGMYQFEAKFTPSEDFIKTTSNIQLFYSQFTKKYNAIFSAKPFVNQPGNSMHINISLYDLNLHNLFYKDDKVLNYSIGGLCALMSNSMIYFAPHEESYLRYKNKCYHTPTTISWGINNRTTAIRILKKHNDSHNTRIEHRIPCANADSNDVILSILLSILYGLKKRIKSPDPIYGLAQDLQYKAPKLPLSLEESLQYTPTANMLKNIIEI